MIPEASFANKCWWSSAMFPCTSRWNMSTRRVDFFHRGLQHTHQTQATPTLILAAVLSSHSSGCRVSENTGESLRAVVDMADVQSQTAQTSTQKKERCHGEV